MGNPFGSDISCHSDVVSQSSLEQSFCAGPWGRKKHLSLSDVPMFSPSVGHGVDMTSDGELVQVENLCSTLSHETRVSESDNGIHVSEPDRPEMEFVRIPKSEYEAIKNRVSAIENRISQEFGNMITTNNTVSNMLTPSIVSCSTEVNSNAELVQTAYERTLVESEKLGDSSADHLARRLSRELRFRRSLESKVMRSPSARKIGTIRRRSKENAKPALKLPLEKNEVPRNMSWHLAVRPSLAQIGPFYPCSNLKRGRPNTVFTGLPLPSPRNTVNMSTRMTHKCQEDLHSEDKNKERFQNYSCLMDDKMNMTDLAQYLDFYRELDGPITRSKARRASSFHGSEWAFRNHRSNPETDVMKSNSYVDISETIMHNSLSLERNANDNRTEQQKENDEWKTADVFFSDVRNIKEEAPITGRASVAKLRSQNAGMVLERMKLFDAKTNCTVRHHEKEKSMIDSKAKRLVHVPSVFVHRADVTQSLKVTPAKKNISRSSHSKSVQRIHSPLLAKSGIDDLQYTFKDSPKKIGTPRRKHGMRSPNGSHQKQRLKIVKLPSRVGLVSTESPVSAVRKKHNSMKLARERVCTDMKANLTVPVIWLSTEKENLLSPSDNTYLQPNLSSQRGLDLKEEPRHQFFTQTSVSDTCKEVCSPAVNKTSMSPLKDCNRIEINNQIPHLTGEDTSVVACSVYRTPRETPYIKKALLTKSPSQFCKTPQNNPLFTNKNGRRLQTPVKAVVAFGSETPVGSPGRRSPRLLSLNLQNLS
jgi:hypothetical protein